MQVALAPDGNPLSPFLTACAGRRISLGNGEDGPHPLQVIPARWRDLAPSLAAFATDLEAVTLGSEEERIAVVNSFRRVVYDAVELFDAYAQLLPARLGRRHGSERSALKTYESTAKRLRAFWALLCNRCKHEAAQISFLWAVSEKNGRTSARYLVSTYSGGDSLVRDDIVHKGQRAGLGLVRAAHEFAHALLRTDLAAGKLIEALADQNMDPLPVIGPELPIGTTLKKIAALPATRHLDEPSLHDGLIWKPGVIELTRVTAADLGARVHMQASITFQPPTRTYSIL